MSTSEHREHESGAQHPLRAGPSLVYPLRAGPSLVPRPRAQDQGQRATRPPRRLGRQQRLRLRRLVVVCGSGMSQALFRGVRGAYKCRRCWVFAIFEIVLAPRRCGGRGGVSGAS